MFTTANFVGTVLRALLTVHNILLKFTASLQPTWGPAIPGSPRGPSGPGSPCREEDMMEIMY